MSKLIFKVAYLGWNYHGFQIQPRVKTIEGELVKAFSKIGIKLRSLHEYASRTDAGVSAVSQIIAVKVGREILEKVTAYGLMWLNNLLPDDIRLWAYTIVADDFNLRKNIVWREYIYLSRLEFKPYMTKTLEEIRRIISSREYDYKSIAKPEKGSSLRKIEFRWSILDNMLVFRFRARSFYKYLVRRLSLIFEKILLREISIETLKKALTGMVNLHSIGLAPPQNLILWNIYLPLQFIVDRHSLKSILTMINRRYSEYLAKTHILHLFKDRFEHEIRVV